MHLFSKIILISLIMTFSGSLLAQEYKKIPISKGNENANIIPGTIIIKLKPAFRHYTNNLNSLKKVPSLTEVINKYKVAKFQKMFPGEKEPQLTSKTQKNKPQGPDLSLMHVIHFNPKIPVYELIEKLMASGLVEYAEPQYLVEMQYLPNDPISQPGQEGELLLQRINAYKAWDIEKGDPNVVIGVLDTGTELTHPDLVNNIHLNLADPIDGLDNDGNSKIDDYYGWDTGNNDNNPTWEFVSGQPYDHGVKVQGTCTATPDNNFGVAGTGFHCSSLPIKISSSTGSLSGGYSGIQYAASRGVKVMNLSWGGASAYSQASQDIINDAALTKDVLIIAAAGNQNAELNYYPASYDNVFSVTGLDTIYSAVSDTLVEIRKTFDAIAGMTYSFYVDISSIEGGMTTGSSGSITGFGGSSFASPTVAGAAGLVRSKYPQLSAVQAGELLRVTGDILDTFDVTLPESRYKIGRKLNMFKSVTTTNIPSVRMMDYNIVGPHGQKFFSGDTLTITNDFFNYLSKANNLQIKMICSNGFATVYDDNSSMGFMDSLTSKHNIPDPFKIVINQNAGANQVIELVLIMTDASTNYYDYQGFKFTVNPPYVDLDTNKIKTTITSNGRIGYYNYPTSGGLGLSYLNNPLLYEGGLMIGASSTKVSDCVRSAYPSVEDQFKSIKTAHYTNPTIKDQEIGCKFNDSYTTDSSKILVVDIDQKSYAWKNSPNDKFVIIEYNITNKSSITYDSIFAGIYTDWDIADPSYNRADWDDATKLAYTYSTQGGSKVAGVALLTDNSPSCYSLEYPNISGSIDGYSNFSTSRKYSTMANGVARKQAGMANFGSEVSQVTSAKILNFAPGETETVAFAFVVGDNIFEIINNAKSARDKFVSIKQGPIPVASNSTICSNDTIDITIAPYNGNNFAFFNSTNTANPLYTGNSYTMLNVSNDDTIYVANKDSLFYSALKPVYINKDKMTLAYFPSTDTIDLPEGGTLLLVNQSFGASFISWDLGDLTAATGNSVTHIYNTAGFYNIKLSGISPLNCNDTLTRVLHVKKITSTTEEILNGTQLKFYPNPVSNILTIDFTNNTIPSDLSMELTNAIGISIPLDKSKINSINMTDLASGIYYLKLTSGSDVINKKIIKN